ncbi:FtsK/SpoIIIE domain-containing protein [Streptomyces sp. NBC_01433]|uniref:FtsK/SpoIIIE domain-containing protein n=1 Tax=Streptomyces sp. NBC_01433 TaxID=2903864 RepID=UPI002252DFE6|nr:FtsK/SpoIIIE domain-containing protein [Streptomyces sp. NBC_01433]MCX4682640.1 FtsK/SpoIIIE domain-containing protein [Streptomyces sp. NBC_01433]MCX4682680.1 FtsK/SpoIIIE domain-containing protein [Streptomyces sp. NBC_01433]
MTEQPTASNPDRTTLATITYLHGAGPATDTSAPAAAPALGGTSDTTDKAAVVESARRILEGTVTKTAGDPSKPEDPDFDVFDDSPLIPAWARSGKGWAMYSGVFYRARVRGYRRWVRRQRTDRGHVAQFRRGRRRVQDWVRGFEGVQLQAIAHQAHIAAAEARSAARTARYTPSLMQNKKLAAQQQADRTQTVAMQAIGEHKRLKATRRRAYGLRLGVAYGPPAAAIAAGYAQAGWLGATAGSLVTFSGGAFAGRHQITEETDWSADWRSLGDGDAMTAPMLDECFRAAKVIGGDESLAIIQMPMLDVRGAWSTIVDLPPGIPAKKAMRGHAELASAFGVEEAQLSISKNKSKGARAGRLELYVSKDLPFTGDVAPGPLLALEGAANFWGRIQIGPDVRGLAISISVVERSGLVGGEPGAGKSASGNTILLAAALDPRVILWLADGKGGGDLEPFEGLCECYEGAADPEAFDEMLDAAILDMKNRYALLKKLGKRKVTEDLSNKHPELRQKLLWVDELMLYTTDEEFGKKITKKLRNLVSRGRAAGIITFCATQKPGSDVVDTSLRDLLSIRWALRCTTPEASDTILGKGAAASGYSAKTIEPEMRGAGLLWAEGSNPVLVRADYYSDDEVTLLLERAYDLRAKAGTLPAGPRSLADQLRETGEDEGQVLAVLVDVFGAYDQAAKADDESAAVDWLPGTVLVDALQAAGLAISPEKLARLVVREADEKRKRAWEDSTSALNGYPLTSVLRAVETKYGLTA